MQGILMIDVVTALPALAALIIFVIPQPQADPSAHTAPGGQTSLLGDLRQGAQFLLSWRGLFYICLLAMLLNFLLTPTAALMPLLVKDHFAGTATDLATLESAIGIAIIVGGLLLSVWGGFKRRIVTALVAVIGIGCGSLFIGLAQSHMFGLALAGAAGTGFMQVFANGPLLAMMQSTVPNHMQGRVNSLMSSGSMLMSPLSLAVAGPLADVIGVRAWFIAGGIGCIVIAAMAMFSRDIMNVENRTALPQSIELVEMR
jgi:DHA3 family macrolide efflux protein-like MFS transporter